MLAAWQFRLEPVTFQEFQAWKADPTIPKLLPKAVRVASMIPLPGPFWRGGMSLVSSNHNAVSYLLGKTVPGGHPLYFLVAMAVKVPLPIQILLGIALLSVIGAALRGNLRAGDWCWIVPGLLYLALASFAGLQLGIRLVLPAIVFLLLASGRAFDTLWFSRLKPLAFVLLLFLVAKTAHAYPNYISYFNLWVGNSWQGIRILSDSNVDWGQDLRSLQNWYQHAGISKFSLAYFGTETVWAYFNDRQIDPLTPPWNAELAQGRTRLTPAPGYYAVSATLLSGQFFPPGYRDYFGAFRELTPIARAGESIFIYRVP
jgi:hypothetical protein